MYKYSLDKSSKKFVCPACGKKRFVKYVDNETNSFLEDGSGRCDRESSCKYQKTPHETSVISEFVTPKITRKASTIQSDYLKLCNKNFHENNLIQFLENYFTKEEIQLGITKYRLGNSKHWNGAATIFWQINPQYEVMTGKIMQYDVKTGKRVKEPKPLFQWVHKLLKLEDFVLLQCLFGLHLVNHSTKKEIAIVESEKTAFIMSLFLPNYVWMSTGGKKNFNLKMLLPIKEYTILAYPDKSEYDDWNKTAIELQKLGFKINCSRFVEDKNVPDGTDLADIYLESRTNNNPVKVQKQLTKTEIELNRLAKINPEIINLIRTFDLLDNEHNEIVILK
jgi:hypothetical protein